MILFQKYKSFPEVRVTFVNFLPWYQFFVQLPTHQLLIIPGDYIHHHTNFWTLPDDQN